MVQRAMVFWINTLAWGKSGHHLFPCQGGKRAALMENGVTHMNTSAMIRPAWTPATIALMVLGFMVFWPLGLAMLAYIIWGDRLEGFKRDVNRATDDVARSFRGFGPGRGAHNHGGHPASHARTGNVAFDDWRTAELERLTEERRKLDALREEFDSHMRELRRAKDQDEFDRFMANRNRSTAPAKKDDSDKDNLLDD